MTDFNIRYDFYIGLTTQGGSQLDPATVEFQVAQRLALHGIDGFTVTQCRGYWKGRPEDVLVVTVLDHDFYSSDRYVDIAAAFKELFDQETVLLNTSTCHGNLI